MRLVTFFSVFLSTLFAAFLSHAQTKIEANSIYSGQTGQKVSFDSVLQKVKPGTIVLVSEIHDLGPHQEKQVEFMSHVHQLGMQVSIGMEFLAYPFQNYVNQYISGELAEADFLKNVKWGNNNFDLYRQQILFSQRSGGKTLAINAPRTLSSKVARSGLDSLTESERAMLPPNFQVGSDDYLRRFWAAVGGHHVPKEKVKNYFTAQSIWDDTMAWQSIKHMEQYPNDVLVIVVGDFHAVYNQGLPARLKARGANDVLVLSQMNLSFYESDEEARKAILPHEEWGVRADFIWTSSRTEVFHTPQ